MRIFKKLTVILMAAFIAGCSGGAEKPGNEVQVKTVNVESRTLQPETYTSYLQLIGTVQAANDVRLSAEESGRVLRYYPDEGDFVEKGELIAKIDDRQLRQDAARFEALTEQSRETYERQKRLWEQDSVGSEIEYLNAKYNYQQNKANLEATRVRISKTELRAPFKAKFERKLVEEGETVSPGVPMVRLIANDQVKVVTGVPARYSEVVQPGDTARVWFDTVDSDTLKGKITFVGSSIDPSARTFRTETVLPNTGHRYKVDMVANIRLQTMRRPGVLMAGEEFLYEKNGGYIVYIVGKNDEGETVAKEQPVKLGPSYNNRAILQEGVKPGDELITVGSSFLKDNMRIKIVNQSGQTVAEQNGVQ